MEMWSEKLLDEYQESKEQLKKKVAALNDEDMEDKEDIKIINSMIRDMDFVIEWLESGIMPELNRKKQRAYTYKNEFVYGVNGYWDDSVGGFVSMNHYKDPYKEVVEKIDREMEGRRREAS